MCRCVEVKGQLPVTISFPPPFRSWGWNSNYQTYQKFPLPPEPTCCTFFSLLSLNIDFNFVYVFVCVSKCLSHVCKCPWRPDEGVGCPGAAVAVGVRSQMWMLGSELRSYVRAASVLNIWGITRAPLQSLNSLSCWGGLYVFLCKHCRSEESIKDGKACFSLFKGFAA